ncbi:Cu(I)-responsive transcriptional regulator [Paraburkholderia fungorum]|uniref:Cu(I)-responsive transcriptional regulator n=1 Tax=Paraburkholderia fungorum TaxID=134537 RepID=A0AAW3UZL5_9BURK|nr:Cu(I)-responsive transcriptional regulator [Paraburkholderia fungorum]MBB4518624.1 Cu(I)-responsive transcriptional regulator [Paraburkholderia fungorum]MBB6204109.1 Cu(I)-responsive transcriptional regulator [Paraburkholderia fungorum]
MNIGQAAKASGVSAKMIRYYESIDLVQARGRTQGGYRVYVAEDVHTLRFIRQARTLGFSIEQIRRLLQLWQVRGRASADVKAVASERIRELEARIEELRAMRETLAYLAAHCSGNERPDCPILEGLGDSLCSEQDLRLAGGTSR